MSEFVHLHVHTEYSLKQSTLRIATAVQMAANQGMTALAMTDTNAMYGAVRFYREARRAGIKPILGVQLSVAENAESEAIASGRREVADTVVLLAKSYRGYQNIVALVTLCQARSRYPCVTFTELGAHSSDVFALIAGGESVIPRCFHQAQFDDARRWFDAWQAIWPSDALYVDIQDHGVESERSTLPAVLAEARARNLPLVATNDVHYAKQDDADVQHVLAQIESGPGVRVLQGQNYHFTSGEEMRARFSRLPEALENTVKIASFCNLELPMGEVLLPKYPTQTGESAQHVLERAAVAGAKKRYGALTVPVKERLNYELSVIARLGFADYFLVVADFIRFAHKNGISTGPGRGSAAASLVAYALRITDVDPLANQLLFERFLNPERVSWPDIDTDFEYERRGEVIHYVVKRYGAAHVAQIGTFGTLAARAALRDSGRALQTDPLLVDRLAKMIPSTPGMTLADAYQEVAGIGQLVRANHHVQRLWEVASALEGLPRHTSIHAAGVVISPIPLTQLVPLQPGADGIPVTQFAMEDIERVGLVKMDFLGLRTLTLIDRTTDSILQRTGQKVDWRAIGNSDASTFAMLAKGETLGCFQLESSGVRRVLRDLRASDLEDLIAVISLYRPGPMENIPNFIKGKHGKIKVQYPHDDLAAILKDTYGVIVYQEQIMQIAAKMAGFSLGQADLLRKAVSKKKRDVLDQERDRFVSGSVSKGYGASVANEVYDLIVRFADYGFPRAHAAAYAVLAYRTAYLRAKHLPDFLAALLTMVIGNADKTAEYMRDALQHNITVEPPCVTQSVQGYVAQSDSTIRTGLLAVRNVGYGAVEAILEARQSSPFTSVVDFLRRVNHRLCNRKSVESLWSAGAFATFIPASASPEVAKQILDEAYQEAETQKQYAGYGLQLEAPVSVSANRPKKPEKKQLQALYIRYGVHQQQSALRSVLQDVLAHYSGDTAVALYDTVSKKALFLEDSWSVSVTPELISELEEIVGLGNAKLGKFVGARHGAKA